MDLAHIRAKDALGDFTTLDACTLTSSSELPAKYREHGAPKIRPAYEVDDCEVDLTVAPHHTITLWFGELASLDTARRSSAVWQPEDVGGGLTVVRGRSEATFCRTFLLFADGIAMVVSTQADDGSGATKTEVCAAGRDITLAIVAHLRGGKTVGHEIVRASSLRHHDACAYLTASMARSVPHLGAVRPFGDFVAHHECAYEANNGQSVRLKFVRVGGDLRAIARDGTKSTIAGRVTEHGV